MSLWEALFLGFLQGLTEFLPVSSSGHLRVAGEFLPSAADPGAAFTAIVQIGTELAVLVHFRRDIVSILTAVTAQAFGRRNYDRTQARLGWVIVLGSLPIMVLGYVLAGWIETALRNLYITAAMLIGFGVILGVADRIGRKQRAVEAVGWRNGLLMGLAQALALIPGVSRSGATISAGLFLGLDRAAAARFAFLLAIPAVFVSGFYQLFKSAGEVGSLEAGPTLAATLMAFVTGYAVIVRFLKYVSKASYMPFVYYRIAFGGLLLILLSVGILDP